MKLSSSVFENDEMIPVKYTCDGEDVNPPLEFSEVPEKAKSLVLTVDDPDASSGSWDHWLVWNIDPVTGQIEEDGVPENSLQGTNSFGNQEYGGPCPSGGIHHYVFSLFALDKRLDLEPFSGRKELEEAMEGHVLDQAELVGLYQRSKQ